MDIANWTERNCANWGWGHIIFAAIIGLAVFFAFNSSVKGWLEGKTRNIDKGGNTPSVVSYMLDRYDSRGFIPRPAPSSDDDDVFDLMVIGDSSFLIINSPPEFAYKKRKRFTLTPMISQHIETIGGKKVRIHEYYQDGTRTIDTRRALLSGIADPRIDAVVININPFLYFNDWMAAAYTTQRSKILYAGGLEYSDYIRMAVMLRPSDIMMDLISFVAPTYQRRYQMYGTVNAATKKHLPSGLPFPMKKKARSGPFYMIKTWVDWHYPKAIGNLILKSSNRFYAASIQAANLGPGSLGDTTLRANLRSLTAWGKPAILYVPPINPAYRKDPSWPMLQQIVDHIGLIGAQYANDKLHVVTDAIKPTYPQVVYHDPYHMRRGEGFVLQFTDMLEKYFGLPIERKDISNMFGPGS